MINAINPAPKARLPASLVSFIAAIVKHAMNLAIYDKGRIKEKRIYDGLLSQGLGEFKLLSVGRGLVTAGLPFSLSLGMELLPLSIHCP